VLHLAASDPLRERWRWVARRYGSKAPSQTTDGRGSTSIAESNEE